MGSNHFLIPMFNVLTYFYNNSNTKFLLSLIFKNTYRKVASTNASRFVTRLVFKHTQNDNGLI